MTSPATITRCSIVYIPAEIVTLQMMIDNQLAKTRFPPELTKALEELLGQLTK